MKEYSELIKNIEMLRRLIRDFFVFGYKSRNDFDKKVESHMTMRNVVLLVFLMNYLLENMKMEKKDILLE